MAKKTKTTIVEATEVSEHEAVQQVAVQSAIADNSVIASYEIFKAIGRIETSHFYATISDLAIAKQFEEIKNSKKYKDLPYRDNDGNVRHVADLEEFCQVFLHKSYRRCAELSQNLNLLGEELYQQAEQIGFRARDYQALMALPADDQEIVKQAIETQDRDKVIELLQEMATKHKNDKDNLTKDLEETKANYEAQIEINAENTTELNKLKENLAKLKKRVKDMPPVKVGEQIRKEATEAVNSLEKFIRGAFYQSIKALDDHQSETGIDHKAIIAGFFAQARHSLNEVAIEFNVQNTPNDNPVGGWLSDNAEEEAEAALAAAKEEAEAEQ